MTSDDGCPLLARPTKIATFLGLRTSDLCSLFDTLLLRSCHFPPELAFQRRIDPSAQAFQTMSPAISASMTDNLVFEALAAVTKPLVLVHSRINLKYPTFLLHKQASSCRFRYPINQVL